MRVTVKLDLHDDFLLTCETLHVDIREAIKCYTRNVKLFEATDDDSNTIEFRATKIFFCVYLPWCFSQDAKTNENSYKLILDALEEIKELKEESGFVLHSQEYKDYINKLFDNLQINHRIYDRSIISNKSITLDISNDFLILCELAGFHPEHAIQYFIDHLSFPRLLSSYPIDPNRAVTGMVYLNAKKNVTDRLWAALYYRFAKDFLNEFEKIMVNEGGLEQPELEEYAREKMIEYRDLYRSCIPFYKSVGFKINESQYEN